METRERNTTPVLSWRSYTTPCGSLSQELSAPLIFGFESVTSYRGKPQYIQVAGKRRKVFNPFTRYKATASRTLGQWCPSPTKHLNIEDFPYLWLYYRGWENVPGLMTGTPYYFAQAHLQDIVTKYQEFTARDLYSKVNAARFDGAVFLAELGETLLSVQQLFAGAAGALLKADGLWSRVKHFSLNSEELWLWWRYALMPAMLDAEAILQALKPEGIIDRVQCGGRENYADSGVLKCTWDWGVTENRWKAKIKLRRGGAIDLHSRFDPAPFGSSPWDAVRASWEVIPFSFIADWFVNVGDWLNSLRQLEAVFAQSYATAVVETEVKFEPGEHILDRDDPLFMKSLLISRIVDLERPTLPLIDKQWINTLRIVDSITLTIGMLKSILNRRR